MRKVEKQLLVGLVIVGIALITALYLNVLSIDVVAAAGGFVVIGAAAYYVFKREAVVTRDDLLNGANSRLSEEECRQAVEEWSKDAYTNDTKMKMRFTESRVNSTPVQGFDGKEKLVYAFTTPFGDSNRGVQVFYEATEQRVVDHLPLVYEEQWDMPFKFSEYVQGHRERNRQRVRAAVQASKRARSSGGGTAGMPVDSEFYDNLTEIQDGGDENE